MILISLRHFVKHLGWWGWPIFTKDTNSYFILSTTIPAKTWERERERERESKKTGEFVERNGILNNIWKPLYVLRPWVSVNTRSKFMIHLNIFWLHFDQSSNRKIDYTYKNREEMNKIAKLDCKHRLSNRII